MVIRRTLGRLIEWVLGYEREVYFTDEGYWVWDEANQSHWNMTGKPYKKHESDAGYDLFINKPVHCKPQTVTEIPSGICVDPKSRIWFEIKSRSSTFHRLHLEVLDAVIDNGYRGELFAIVYNPNDYPILLDPGMRICQIVPHLIVPCRFRMVKQLSDSDRGVGGFGSTGQ